MDRFRALISQHKMSDISFPVAAARKYQMKLSCTAISHISLGGLTTVFSCASVTGAGGNHGSGYGDDSD